MVLERLEKKVGLPPLRDISKILSGEGGKRIDTILARLERLSNNQEALVEARKLMEVIHAMGMTGDLERLDSILKNMPHGRAGATLISSLKDMLADLIPKLEKFSALAERIMSARD